jgi:hypothetical protein
MDNLTIFLSPVLGLSVVRYPIVLEFDYEAWLVIDTASSILSLTTFIAIKWHTKNVDKMKLSSRFRVQLKTLKDFEFGKT